MDCVKFYKEDGELPVQTKPDAFYFVLKDGKAVPYLTANSGDPIPLYNAEIAQDQIDTSIVEKLKTFSSVEVVTNIVERNGAAAGLERNMIFHVLDASGDPDVGTGQATYVYRVSLDRFYLVSGGGSGGSGQPSIAGSVALNGTTNNTVAMAGIVTALGLETGDVIRIDAGAYNKLHTVESITSNDSIIVNYEHAGNRGDGSLKLPNFTGQATVTRIAKWFNAPIGLGQEWVNVSTNRSAGITYTNTAGRPISALVSGYSASGDYPKAYVDSTQVLFPGGTSAQNVYSVFLTVSAGATYSVELQAIGGWMELR